MAAVWTTPQTWALDDVFQASVANIHIRNNLEYLFNRPKSYVNLTYASDELLPSLSWAKLADYSLSLTTESGVIHYAFNAALDTTSGANFDVYVPELNIWLSSGTSTQDTGGIAYRRSASANYAAGVHINMIRDLGASGDYTFELWYKSLSATLVKFEANIMTNAFVKEV